MIKISQEDGARVCLGDKDDSPNLLIERRPNGWALFIHPDDGDPAGLVYILDDGRTYLQPAQPFPGFTPIEILPDSIDYKEIDQGPTP